MLKKVIFRKILPYIYKQYLKIRLKTEEFKICPKSRCLVLVPHADDESIAMGGTLIKYNKNFDVLLLTDGRLGLKHLDADKAIKLRKKEFEDAMKFANIHRYSFLDIKDQDLCIDFEKFSKINLEGFDMIFLPNFLDHHLDHKAISINLKKLLVEKRNSFDFSNLKVVFYEVWSALALPNRYVDISDVVEQKKKMLQCHKSQLEITDYLSSAIGLNAYRGIIPKTSHAEAFLMLDAKDFVDLIDEIYPMLR